MVVPVLGDKDNTRESTPSFVLTLPIKTTPSDEKKLSVIFECCRYIYNACLGEALKRLNILRRSKEFQQAVKLTNPGERKAGFNKLNHTYGFTEYAMHEFVKPIQKSWLKQHVGSHLAQKMATRAFKAVQRYAFGKAGRVHFKSKGSLTSIEGKNNISDITFDPAAMVVVIGKKKHPLTLPVIVKPKDSYAAEALTREIKFCRVLKRENRYCLQIVLKGAPPLKIKQQDLITGEAAADIGPSTIALVSCKEAYLEKFCPQLDDLAKERRRLQRKMDRQRRAGNPDNYNHNGTIKPGRKSWHMSKQYLKVRSKHQQICRKIAAKRKEAHDLLIKYILTHHGKAVGGPAR